MTETTQLQQQIDALNYAIRSGESSVTFNGRTVAYRSVGDLIRARDDAVAEQVQARRRGGARTFHFNFKTLRGD